MIVEDEAAHALQLGNAFLAMVVLDLDDALIAGRRLAPLECAVLSNFDRAVDFQGVILAPSAARCRPPLRPRVELHEFAYTDPSI